jgi:DNA polymerase II
LIRSNYFKFRMNERTGWLLDLYAHPEGGLVLWFLTEDGERLRLKQAFPVTFYASGPRQALRAAWRWLQSQPEKPRLARAERRELMPPGILTLLAVQVDQPVEQPRLFARLARAFPGLAYYDADLQLWLRYAAVTGAFPLARCCIVFDDHANLQSLKPLDSPWDLDPAPAPLRILSIEPDHDPRHAEPTALSLHCERADYQLPLEPVRALLVSLAAILRRHDPDLLLTAWGDTWFFPWLLARAAEFNLQLPFNREPGFEVAHRPERTYFSYGQVIYQGPQALLFGRSHIDIYNAMLFHDYGLEGILELARVAALPLQTTARASPGTGISAMQIVQALRQGVLVPWHKQRPEDLKTALDLLRADQGGLVYQPLTGLHRDVAEIDFISMYPSIMVHFNISPETIGPRRAGAHHIPELDLWVEPDPPGLVPETLEPLLYKRIRLKALLATLPAWDPRRKLFKARASAHKWLLVTCFGYLGYKNARFGRIEAHEAVTAYGRETLLRAKEAAEDQGYTVLHMYVDGLWVHKPGCATAADLRPLLDEILARTGLPVALEGIYRWVAFLSSRSNPAVPVPNRYFGVFQDGSMKLRGIELRRRDTPPFIKQVQQEMLELLARLPGEPASLVEMAPVLRLLRHRLGQLRQGQVALEALLVTHKVSRKLEEFRTPSPAARALAQLQGAGKTLRPGQHVRFLYTLGQPGVHAWGALEPPDPQGVDFARYRTLLLRAAATLLQPFGLSEAGINQALAGFALEAVDGRLLSRLAAGKTL